MTALHAAPVAMAHATRTGPARLRDLRGAALADSAGLAFGWTVFVLVATRAHGVGAAAIYQAAACAGAAAAAPFSRWISVRVAPRQLIRTLAVVEAALRAAALVLLVAGTPAVALLPVVLIMNTVAWSGYAAMRAEVAAIAEGSGNLTRYALTVAATEALAAAAAGCLPLRGGAPGMGQIAAVVLLYSGALLPTWLAAACARGAPHPGSGHRARQLPTLLGGGLVTLLAAGPALLAVPLAATWYGATGVVIAALAFTAGTLLAPRVSAVLDRTGLPARLSWPALGVVALLGWSGAQLCLPLLGLAQLCAGVSQVALEGTMDGYAVRGAPAGQHTGILAGAAAVRSLAGAAAVGLLPVLTARTSLSGYALAAAGALTAAAAVLAVRSGPLRQRAAGPC